MYRTRATRSQAASLPASPSGSGGGAFQTGASAASSPLQRSSTTTTATRSAVGATGAGDAEPSLLPSSAAAPAGPGTASPSGRRGQIMSASRVESRQTPQLAADGDPAHAEATRETVNKGKSVARESGASTPTSADGRAETIAGDHALLAAAAPGKEAANGDDDEDEAQRKRQIERVLKRAQAARLARSFRNRVQLAAFKNQRGWQDVKLDVIEPHLEQEAQQRKQHTAQVVTPEEAALAAQRAGQAQALFAAHQSAPSHHQQQQYQLPVYMPSSRSASNTYQPQLGGGGMDAILGGREFVAAGAEAPSPATGHHHQQQRHLYPAQQQQQQQLYPHDGPPVKRARTGRGDIAASYNAHDVYAPQSLPAPRSAAPYATTQLYQPPLAGGSRYGRMFPDALAHDHNAAAAAAAYEHVWDSRTSPDGSRSLRQRGPFPGGMPTGTGHDGNRHGGSSSEMYALPAPAAQRPPVNSSPRTRAASRRASPPKQPLSSSDPTFSSFVDAANALTGMARAPSDPALNGIENGNGNGMDDEHGGPHGIGRQSIDLQAGGMVHDPPPRSRHSSSAASGQSAGAGGYARLTRPSTPERQVVRLPGAPNGAHAGGGGSGGAGGGDGGATAEGAAELMLFLAASPSPVQNRKAPPPPTLGDGMPKGRRLFSGTGGGGGADAGAGGDPASAFGGELDAFGSTAAAAPNTGTSTMRAHHVGPGPAPFATASPSADPSKHFAAAPSASSSSATLSDPRHHPLPQQQQERVAYHEPQTAFMPPEPATPGQHRQRQPSLGGAWESFINASPSPKRAARRSRGGVGAGGYGNELADEGGTEGPGGGAGGSGGIGGGPGNGQATVTW